MMNDRMMNVITAVSSIMYKSGLGMPFVAIIIHLHHNDT